MLHTCDNRACVNPDHLYLGNQKENIRDTIIRGRQPTGENRHNAKLTESAVRDIRSSKLTVRQLAAKYGVGSSTIQHAKSLENWKHVT